MSSSSVKDTLKMPVKRPKVSFFFSSFFSDFLFSGLTNFNRLYGLKKDFWYPIVRVEYSWWAHPHKLLRFDVLESLRNDVTFGFCCSPNRMIQKV